MKKRKLMRTLLAALCASMLISAMSVTAMADDDVVLDDGDEEVVLDDELDVMYGAAYANGATSQPSVTTSPTDPDNPDTGTTEPPPQPTCMCKETTTNATCSSQGSISYDTSACPMHVDGRAPVIIPIDPNAHTWPDDWEVIEEATCSKEGIQQKKCGNGCEKTQTEKIEKKLHTWDKGTETTKPTEEAVGVMTYSCTVCGEIKTEDIPELKHEFSEDWSSNETGHWHKCPNCDRTDGFSGHTWKDGGVCSTCEYGCNHIMGEFEVTKEPTCTELGEKVKKCKNNCGMTETASIPMLPHNYVAEKAPVIVYCDKPYTYTVTARCSKCSATRKYNGTNPAAGHDWGAKDENDVAKCSRCNVEAILDSNGNIVRILAEGEDVGREEEIVIKLPELEPEPDPDETKSDDKPEEKTEDKPEEKVEEKPEAKPSADDKQTSNDKPKEDKPKNTTSKPSDNPNSGVTMAILPLAVAAAIVIFKKKG